MKYILIILLLALIGIGIFAQGFVFWLFLLFGCHYLFTIDIKTKRRKILYFQTIS